MTSTAGGRVASADRRGSGQASPVFRPQRSGGGGASRGRGGWRGRRRGRQRRPAGGATAPACAGAPWRPPTPCREAGVEKRDTMDSRGPGGGAPHAAAGSSDSWIGRRQWPDGTEWRGQQRGGRHGGGALAAAGPSSCRARSLGGAQRIESPSPTTHFGTCDDRVSKSAPIWYWKVKTRSPATIFRWGTSVRVNPSHTPKWTPCAMWLRCRASATDLLGRSLRLLVPPPLLARARALAAFIEKPITM